jgi:hypothetical protein
VRERSVGVSLERHAVGFSSVSVFFVSGDVRSKTDERRVERDAFRLKRDAPSFKPESAGV